MLDAVRDIRIEDPGIGCYKLWIMLTVLLEPGSCLGFFIAPATPLDASCPQDPAYDELNHRYHKWKNLIKGLTLTSGQLWVSDITYIPLANGEVLHLITDAYSHKIVGWVPVSATINALQQAIEQAVEMTEMKILRITRTVAYNTVATHTWHFFRNMALPSV